LIFVSGLGKVVKLISDIFSDKGIYTLVERKEICDELGFDYAKIRTSAIQKFLFGLGFKFSGRLFLGQVQLCSIKNKKVVR
jgi:hypothetical protein